MHRFRRLVACGLGATLCLIAACEPVGSEGSASRFAAAKKGKATKAGESFCEQQWPAGGAEARKYRPIPERAIPGVPVAAAAGGGRWKWVNLWATWCLPCVEEMALLDRWQRALAADDISLELEMWSVDDDQAKLVDYLRERHVPGQVRWLRAADDLPAVLESLGADRMSALPVHALVDADGHLRCVRVGSVHDEDYGAVKTILTD